VEVVEEEKPVEVVEEEKPVEVVEEEKPDELVEEEKEEKRVEAIGENPVKKNETGGKTDNFLEKVKEFFNMKGGIIGNSNLEISFTKNNILPHRMNHNKYGFFYYFSNDILEEDLIENISRYVVFITNCKYIINEKSEMPNELEEKEIEDEEDNNRENDEDEDEYEDLSSIYFQTQNNVPLWCVKSSYFFVKI